MKARLLVMDKKLSDIRGMEIPDYSKSNLKKILSKDALWEFIVNVYPDMIKTDDDVVKNKSFIMIDVQVDSQQSASFTPDNVQASNKEERIWKKTSQVSLTKLLI